MLQEKDESSLVAEQVIDYTSLVLYFGLSIFFFNTAYKTLKNKENRNLQNILTVVFILFTLISKFSLMVYDVVRIWTLIYQVRNVNELLDFRDYNNKNMLWKIAFFFDLPFECMILAAIVQFF